MLITDLGEHPEFIDPLARWHFNQFGALSGAADFESYLALLTRAAQSREIPSVLIAIDEGRLCGSASLVASDLPPRDTLAPWLAQLFVEPTQRSQGIGAALVHSVMDRARGCGCNHVYLYTSGTLPQYYARLGWKEIECLEYLGRERTVMEYGLDVLETRGCP